MLWLLPDLSRKFPVKRSQLGLSIFFLLFLISYRFQVVTDNVLENEVSHFCIGNTSLLPPPPSSIYLSYLLLSRILSILLFMPVLYAIVLLGPGKKYLVLLTWFFSFIDKDIQGEAHTLIWSNVGTRDHSTEHTKDHQSTHGRVIWYIYTTSFKWTWKFGHHKHQETRW